MSVIKLNKSDRVHKQSSVQLSEGYLDLSSILKSFNSPLNEEHVWGICYQFSIEVLKILENPVVCHLVEQIEHLYIHRDGYVHKDSFYQVQDPLKKPPNELDFIFNLGEILVEALHFGMGDDEERNLSPQLADLLTSMEYEVPEEEAPDEGFDIGDPENLPSFKKILDICTKRLGSSYSSGRESAENYYRDICKALVSESIDLSSFLQKISQGPKDVSKFKGNPNHADLDQLNLNDWAKTWINVVGQLRNGVRLKKVDDLRNTPVEYTLTPYEILMNDIKSQKYQLKSVKKLPPKLNKTANDLILDFIRSRPPLRRAQDRVLSPRQPQQLHPIELLMDSIRKGHPLKTTIKGTIKKILQ